MIKKHFKIFHEIFGNQKNFTKTKRVQSIHVDIKLALKSCNFENFGHLISSLLFQNVMKLHFNPPREMH